MRLTQWTDYTLRVLMYCAACVGREMPVTITEIAESHGISRSHLTKIVQELGARGWLETTRGRGGGMRLLVRAQDICLGEVVRATETDFAMVECFDADLNQCRLSQHCRLKSVLNQATQSYLAVLDGITLADLIAPAGGIKLPLNAKRVLLRPGIPVQPKQT
ncbi:MAG: Rrf2 family transcriptional regulator [Betaproteobacteria bacterium]|nr:Rrf2 family transcriptional regulator [Betaproteobacteria bacterium]NCP82380.1 Rrf2 family transcriptional regulator [Rhodoferax sp.]OIP16108.1 MAG: Rrf2 family transcriptional regulator [Comamonadaceae bacterium CG2_30_57_122]PIZ21690.1 MAG: Rrf2 family transcriptional regulator [Comamonadaceae bacterium CG_4_10_14_0_8_um_filter_57_29]PJC15252.1 MAG: Rrf2 family transcriptional regulator [Comamonadaceae bacterium CG_4_9_14_0_8_um_filter_57_21]